MVFKSLEVLCPHKRNKGGPLLKQLIGSSLLLCECCSALFEFVLRIACEEDRDFVACIAEKEKTHTVQSMTNRTGNKYRLCWCKHTYEQKEAPCSSCM